MNRLIINFLKKNKKSNINFNKNLFKQLKLKKLNISFSQNFEDLILKRLFPSDNSFYVDVGANSPIINSNTMLFYLEGSRGINIDAQEKVVKDLKTFRAKDKNILALIDSSKKTVEFNYHKISSRSSSNEKFIDLSKRGLNNSDHQTNLVNKITTTLTEILKKNKCPKQFNFLNVDVEGSEFNALKGLDLNIYKPKIIIVETSPPYDLDRKYKKNFRNDKFKIKSYLNKHDYTILYEDLVNTWFCKKRNSKSFKKKISFPISKLYDNFITFQHFQSLVNKK